jgi:hypothetical protein
VLLTENIKVLPVQERPKRRAYADIDAWVFGNNSREEWALRLTMRVNYYASEWPTQLMNRPSVLALAFCTVLDQTLK